MGQRLALLATLVALSGPAVGLAAGSVGVIVNGRELGEQTLRRLAQSGLPVPPGRYWYDRRSGLWGYQGGPTRGRIAAGLPLGGRLRANASAGRSSLSINGRRLTHGEVAYLRQLLGRVVPGRYWMDRWGNVGIEGGPPLLNIFRIARSNRVTRYRKHGINYLSDGSFTGVSVRGVGGKTTSVYIDH